LAALRYRHAGHSAALKARRTFGSHDGLRVELSGGHQWPLGSGLRLTLEGYLTYADNNTTGAFYGIDAVQASASGRPAFRAEAGLERWGARLRLGRSFGRHWGASVGLDHGWLLGDARRSPLTTRDSQLQQLSFAVFHQF
jgi:outer membrane scaffolding protein for murein synthesis (MipA/OmpV family)